MKNYDSRAWAKVEFCKRHFLFASYEVYSSENIVCKYYQEIRRTLDVAKVRRERGKLSANSGTCWLILGIFFSIPAFVIFREPVHKKITNLEISFCDF